MSKRPGLGFDPKVNREIVPHGFRSCFRDWAAEHGYDDAIAEAALAHKVTDDVIAAYKRTTFFELRKRLMNDWADYCGRNVFGEENLVPLRV